MASNCNNDMLNLCLNYAVNTDNRRFSIHNVFDAYGIRHIGETFKNENLAFLQKTDKIFQVDDDMIEISIKVTFKNI
jgi:hypothetical protein